MWSCIDFNVFFAPALFLLWRALDVGPRVSEIPITAIIQIGIFLLAVQGLEYNRVRHLEKVFQIGENCDFGGSLLKSRPVCDG